MPIVEDLLPDDVEQVMQGANAEEEGRCAAECWRMLQLDYLPGTLAVGFGEG
jgi:hypothetical protein